MLLIGRGNRTTFTFLGYHSQVTPSLILKRIANVCPCCSLLKDGNECWGCCSQVSEMFTSILDMYSVHRYGLVLEVQRCMFPAFIILINILYLNSLALWVHRFKRNQRKKKNACRMVDFFPLHHSTITIIYYYDFRSDGGCEYMGAAWVSLGHATCSLGCHHHP